MQFLKFATIPVVLLVTLIFGVLFFDFSEAFIYNPPYLLLTFNLIFYIGATAAVIYISIKSFLKLGSLAVLLVGTSIFIFALSTISAGWVGIFSSNYSITIGNICSLVASIVQVAASILSLEGKYDTPSSDRKLLLTTVFVASFLFVEFTSVMALSGLFPSFFMASGPTLIRQVVLGLTISFFAEASLIFGIQYVRSRSSVLLLYTLAIGLFSLGLFSSFTVETIGDVTTWLGRITLYTGTIYLLISLLMSRSRGVNFSNGWIEAFKQDKLQFDALITNMNDGFGYYRIVLENGEAVDYVFVDINEAYMRITGLGKEILGKRASEVYGSFGNDLQERIKVYGKVALTGEPTKLEFMSSKSEKWLAQSVYSIEKGCFAGVIEDITARKKAEEELKKSRDIEYSRRVELEAVMATTPAYVWIAQDSECRNMIGNKAVYELLQLPPNSNISQSSFVKERPTNSVSYDNQGLPIPPENLPLQEAARTGKPVFGFEFEMRFDDGRRVWLYGNATPMQDANGSVQGSVGVFIDITQMKQLQTKLNQYAKSLEGLVEERTKQLLAAALYSRNLIEVSMDPLVTISAEGKITDVNSATELATGVSRERLIGCDFSDFFTEPEKARVGYQSVFKEGFIRDYPLSIRNVSGRVTYVLYNAIVYRNESGKVQGVFATARDMTEYKALEEKLKNSERLAYIGQTAGMVGHDLRNPLQSVEGAIYLAKEELKSIPENQARQSVHSMLDMIDEQVTYMNKIVSDLQDFVRPLTPKFEMVDIKKLVESALSGMNFPENIQVEKSLREDRAVLDSVLMTRVLINLITNAIQAMPKGGRLTLEIQREGNSIQFSVSDTGVGIPEDVRPKLFTPLFTTKSKGQGFGLAVCKRIVESHGGEITFESAEGKGTTFSVRIPSLK
ncbi:MAG: hypothetical protein QG670_2910 [Thermoproteota archaeon]|nr:hypothetical protein [Thermoproteota archaeon]